MRTQQLLIIRPVHLCYLVDGCVPDNGHALPEYHRGLLRQRTERMRVGCVIKVRRHTFGLPNASEDEQQA